MAQISWPVAKLRKISDVLKDSTEVDDHRLRQQILMKLSVVGGDSLVRLELDTVLFGRIQLAVRKVALETSDTLADECVTKAKDT